MVYCVALAPLLYFSSELYTFIAQPLLNTLPLGSHLVATQVVTPFTIPLKLALFTSLILIVPFILFHGWAFVAPGLYRHEKKMVQPLLWTSTVLFYLGIGFAHAVVLPMALGFFSHIAPKGVIVMTDITHYLDFILTLYFAFGAAFQVPIITFVLIRTNIVSIEQIKKNRPFVIVGAFIIGMLLTPPDVVSQILLALPLLALFEGGLLLASFYKPAVKRGEVQSG
jgi:sec-independent protein translocase protein TatC